MRKTILLFILTLLLLSVTVHADDTAKVYGNVTDANGRPVSNATVSIGDKWDITDVSGSYQIKDVPMGEQKIQVKKNGKVWIKEDIEIDDTHKLKDLSINIEMGLTKGK